MKESESTQSKSSMSGKQIKEMIAAYKDEIKQLHNLISAREDWIAKDKLKVNILELLISNLKEMP